MNSLKLLCPPPLESRLTAHWPYLARPPIRATRPPLASHRLPIRPGQGAPQPAGIRWIHRRLFGRKLPRGRRRR